MKHLFINGTELDHPSGAWRVAIDSDIRIAPARVMPDGATSWRRHGTQSAQGPYGAPVLTLAIHVQDIDPTTGKPGGYPVLRANETKIKALLRGNYTISEWFDDTGTVGVQANARTVGEIQSDAADDTMSTLQTTIQLVDAFWRDLTEQTVTATTLNLLRGGSAPIADPLIMIAGNGAATYRVTDAATGEWIEYNGTLTAGQYVRIEPLTETCFGTFTAATWAGGTARPGLVRTGAGGFEISEAVTLSMPANTQIRARKAYL